MEGQIVRRCGLNLPSAVVTGTIAMALTAKPACSDKETVPHARQDTKRGLAQQFLEDGAMRIMHAVAPLEDREPVHKQALDLFGRIEHGAVFHPGLVLQSVIKVEPFERVSPGQRVQPPPQRDGVGGFEYECAGGPRYSGQFREGKGRVVKMFDHRGKHDEVEVAVRIWQPLAVDVALDCAYTLVPAFLDVCAQIDGMDLAGEPVAQNGAQPRHVAAAARIECAVGFLWDVAPEQFEQHRVAAPMKLLVFISRQVCHGTFVRVWEKQV